MRETRNASCGNFRFQWFVAGTVSERSEETNTLDYGSG